MINQLTPYLTALLVANGAITFFTLQSETWFRKLDFHVGSVLKGDYLRILSSGFLHVHLMHLAFNMFTLFFFFPVVERFLGSSNQALVVYFAALVLGNLFALLFHKSNPAYRAVGASGAVSGILFSAILFIPNEMLYLFGLIPIPAWAVALLFVGYSIFGIQKQSDNIGHEAHLGGALTGVLVTLVIEPDLLQEIPLLIAGILLPIIVLIGVVYFKPEWLKRLNG